MIATHLADKSALSRMPNPAVGAALGPLLEMGLVATCPVVDLEILYSARSAADYEELRLERLAFENVPIDPTVTDRALHVQRSLAAGGHHRVPIPDLLVAAAAETAGLELIHYDADFETITAVTGQTHRWVVPRGSI